MMNLTLTLTCSARRWCHQLTGMKTASPGCRTADRTVTAAKSGILTDNRYACAVQRHWG